jgi:flagellar biosynthetic protein FliP
LLSAVCALPLGAQEAPPSPTPDPEQPSAGRSTGDAVPGIREMSQMVEQMNNEAPENLAAPIKIVLLLTLLSLIPALLMLTTAFIRIVIVLSFIKRALVTRNVPPPQVITGLALFLTLFVMAPTLAQVNRVAVRPYLDGQMGFVEAAEAGVQPMREFMFSQTGESELGLFAGMSGMSEPQTREDIPTHVLVPSFVISELKRAFQIGFVLYLPFLIVDLVVASVLLSMGMMMLPPMMISAPLKLLLFVLVDGWTLVTESLMMSFGG